MSSRLYTSTPAKGRLLKGKYVLDDCNISRISWTGDKKRRFSPKRSISTKENRSKLRSPRTRIAQNLDHLEKRRMQAVEAMKIAEQRRLRLLQQEELEDSMLTEMFNNLSINSSFGGYLSDGRLKLTRKQIMLREDKHRRINEFLVEQEERKMKKKEEDKKKKVKHVTFKIKNHLWTPRPSSKNGFKAFHYEKELKEEIESKEPLNEVEEDEMEVDNEKPEIIRYTMDELRELCPYGFYFM